MLPDIDRNITGLSTGSTPSEFWAECCWEDKLASLADVSTFVVLFLLKSSFTVCPIEHESDGSVLVLIRADLDIEHFDLVDGRF